MPYGRTMVACHDIPLKGEDGRYGRALHHGGPVAKAQGVGCQYGDGVGPTPVHEGPEALAQVGRQRRSPLAHDAQQPASLHRDQGVQRVASIPAKAPDARHTGQLRHEPVDRSHCVHALREQPYPVGGDGASAEGVLQAHAADSCNGLHPGGGEEPAPRGGCSRHGHVYTGHEPPALKSAQGVVDGGIGPLGQGLQLPVRQERHDRQPSEKVGLDLRRVPPPGAGVHGRRGGGRAGRRHSRTSPSGPVASGS